MPSSRRSFLKSTCGAALGLGVWPIAITGNLESALETVTMQLDWQFNAQFAGLFVADAAGLYTQQGLAVDLRALEPGMVVAEWVAAGARTFGCGEQTMVLAAQARGVPVVAIATMFQASPLALMSLPESAITTLANLRGKRIGLHADGIQALILVMGRDQIERNGIEIHEISYLDKHERLQTGELEAIQCYALDEPLEFAQEFGIEPTLLRFSDYGFEAYSQVIYTRTTQLQQAPETVQRFLTATFDGWRLALDRIPETAELIVSRYAAPDSPYTNVAQQTQSLHRVAQYVQQGLSLNQLGQIDPRRWQRTAEQLAIAGLIPQVPLASLSLALDL